MTERPFIATAPEVRGLLDGSITQFRRPVKVCRKDSDGIFRGGWPIIPTEYGPREGVIGYHPRPDGAMKGRARYVVYLLPDMGLAWRPYGGAPDTPWPAERIGEVCPFGGAGSRLWVRETWRTSAVQDKSGISRAIEYRADSVKRVGNHDEIMGLQNRMRDLDGWRASVVMPHWASRVTIEVLGVKIERVQGISQEDARAEGLSPITKDNGRTIKYGIPDRDGLPGTDDDGWPWTEWCVDPRDAYRRLWDSINLKRAPWNSNPWVWAISFKRVEVSGVTTDEIKEPERA